MIIYTIIYLEVANTPTHTRIPQGCLHMCVIHDTKLNCRKRHADANPNLLKIQFSEVLSEVKEIHQVETYLKLRRL